MNEIRSMWTMKNEVVIVNLLSSVFTLEISNVVLMDGIPQNTLDKCDVNMVIWTVEDMIWGNLSTGNCKFEICLKVSFLHEH